MSYRIHRAMGWGMPIDQFDRLCLLGIDEDGVTESLHQAFSKLTDADLTVDDMMYRALFYADGPKPYPIFQKRLLATEFDTRDNPSPAGRAADLFECIWTGDETLAVLFYPNLLQRKRWHRWDDDLDYAFEAQRGEDEGAPRDFIRYTKFGHYPWSNELMTHDGDHLPWEHYVLLDRRTDWLPAVPSEIRWYLTQHGILDRAGVNHLRPMVAQWWS